MIRCVKFILPVILTAVLAGEPSLADRIYQWTDRSGTVHLTQDPPPAEGELHDVLDFTQEPVSRPRIGPDARQEAPRSATDPAVSGSEVETRRDLRRERALAVGNFCYLRAPDIDVYVRVWEPNDYGERGLKIWSGLIPKNQQQRIASQSGRIIYDYQERHEGPFGGQAKNDCSGGGVVQMLR